ncbi:MAG: nucleoside triphosphate pyrophosphatase [Spongiibacteraceae bacterium]
MPELVLASSSPYRQALLKKLGLSFVCASPDIDETPRPGESPVELTRRLAAAKAHALADRFPHHLIIGSDQAACIDRQVLGKPGSAANAISQLKLASGRRVEFFTGLCLLNSVNNKNQVLVDRFTVHFRKLSDQQIATYVEREQPLDCAGSFKSEGLGIALFERLEGDDPNTQIGLPLIQLTRMLEHAGMPVL